MRVLKKVFFKGLVLSGLGGGVFLECYVNEGAEVEVDDNYRLM